jgi:ribonuclease D|tara:strand:+ start:3734 stop:4351 length:618 start_codon:yes stop_codon:yes gene_type:complete
MNTTIKLHKKDIPADLNLSKHKSLSFDCEMAGLNVLRDPLYLIQISTGNSDAHIVQLDRETFDAPNLKKLLNNKDIIKIFHYARADMAHIKHYLKVDLENIQCTKLQSKISRSYSDSHSLKILIKEFVNIDISKQFQSSDFGGELSPAQLKYCANDVIYLHKIHDELNKILERENRIDLYKNCLKFLKTRVDLDLALFKDDIWSH